MGMSGAKPTNPCNRKNLLSLRMSLCVAGLGFLLEGLGTAAMARVGSGDGPWLAQTETANPAMPSPGATPNPVLLGPGSPPQEVTILQQQLVQLGLYNGPVDGEYNAATQEAVKSFQTSANLATTGRLDSATWERMSTPQLFSEASTPKPEPEMPSLLPSSTAHSGASAAESATSAPEAQSPEAQLTEVNASEANASEPEPAPKSRWSLLRWALPIVALGLVGGAGWAWRQRRHRPDSPEADGTADGGDFRVADGTPHTWAEPSGGSNGTSALAALNRSPSSTSHTPATHTTSNEPPTSSQPLETPAGSSLPQSAPSSASLATWSGSGPPPTLANPARLPTLNIVETLVSELASTDAGVRQRAIWELGQRGNSTAIQPLVNGLLEADSYEKSLIFAALGEIGHRTFQPMQRALILGLKDPSPEVRKNAIRDLSRICGGIGQIRPMLLHAAQDPDPEVQAIAQWALGQANHLPSPPRLDPSAMETSSPEDCRPPLPP